MTQEKAIKRLKLENALLYGLLALSLVYLVVVGENAVLDSRTLTQTALNVQKVFFLWQIYMIWRLARNRRLLREPARLKEHLIQTQDERKGAIWGMAGRKFAPALLIALSAAAVTSSFFDLTVFYTLYYTLLTALALWGGLLLYYRKKL